MGVASVLLALVPAALLIILYRLALLMVNAAPPGADETAYAFGLFGLLLLTILSQLVAFGFGVAGMVQRRRKRLFAVLSVACSVLVTLVINDAVELEKVASFFLGVFEDQPKVVSPGER